MKFFERFDYLSKSQGSSVNAVAKELGLSSGSVTAWKNGTNPSVDALSKIANYFDVSIDYLLGKDFLPPQQEKPATTNDITGPEQTHIEKYRLLNDEGQRRCDENLDDLLGNPKYKKGTLKASNNAETAKETADVLDRLESILFESDAEKREPSVLPGLKDA